jgi:hypothetical protein
MGKKEITIIIAKINNNKKYIKNRKKEGKVNRKDREGCLDIKVSM